MHIGITFASDVKIFKIIEWQATINDFPRLLAYNGINWKLSSSSESPSNSATYDLVFIPVPPDDKDFHLKVIDIESISEVCQNGPVCECGANFSSFNNFHMVYCPLWSKNERMP